MSLSMTRLAAIFGALAVVILQVSVTYAQPSLNSPNVCNKTVTNKRIEIVEEPITYEINYEGRCGIFPCTKSRKEVRMDSRPKVIYEDSIVSECCTGFLEDQHGECQPVCLKGCGNGKCIEPGRCECQPEPSELKPGYSGLACNMYTCLNPNKWGPKCDKPCDCPKHSYCDALGGRCVCRPGWRGNDCSQSCNDTSCGVFELPAFIETELNVIRDIESAPLKLEPDGPEKVEPPTPFWSIGTQLEINIFLMAIIVCLIICYRKQIRALRDNVYYSPTTASSRPSDGSIYSAADYSRPPSDGVNFAKRPLPNPECEKSSNMSSNLSFAAATRSIVNPSKSTPERDTGATATLTGSKYEEHLQSSQENSRHNVYLELDTSRDNFYCTPKSSQDSSSPKRATSVDEDDHSYQVPKSRSVFIKLSQEEDVGDSRECENEVIYEELPYDRN